MHCRGCGQENSGIAKYCNGCGELLSAASQVATEHTYAPASEIIADDKARELEMLAMQKKILFNLKRYPKTSEHAIQCTECDYFGQMGIVSTKYHPLVWWGIGIFILANLFLFKWKYLGKVDLAAFAIVLIRFSNVAQSLKIGTYNCPQCRVEFEKGAKYTGVGSLTPKLIGWTCFALFLIFILFHF
jgi:hypothetical protein